MSGAPADGAWVSLSNRHEKAQGARINCLAFFIPFVGRSFNTAPT